MVSLIGVKGLALPGHYESPTVVDRDPVLLPELLWGEIPGSFVEALKPAFDAMWQAAGHPGWPGHEYEAAKKREPS